MNRSPSSCELMNELPPPSVTRQQPYNHYPATRTFFCEWTSGRRGGCACCGGLAARRSQPLETRLLVTSSDWRNHSCCASWAPCLRQPMSPARDNIKHGTGYCQRRRSRAENEWPGDRYSNIATGDRRVHSGRGNNRLAVAMWTTAQADIVRLLPGTSQLSCATLPPGDHPRIAGHFPRDAITGQRSLFSCSPSPAFRPTAESIIYDAKC